jgi:glutamate-5-semialdehyde dehydrogenase
MPDALITRVERAREASRRLLEADTEAKNRALEAISEGLDEERDAILEANGKDLEEAERTGLAAPLLKRLKFDAGKLQDVRYGIAATRNLQDPTGRVLSARELDEGLILKQVTCPIGVVGMVFESRPDALVQIATLALKSGNAIILKGGSEAAHSNRALAGAIERAARKAGMPEGWIVLIETREDVSALLSMDRYIDLLIPRGSNEFVRHIMSSTAIPVLGHADGVCHVYIDESADPMIAREVTVDSKTQYVAVCNAAETLLVHRGVAPSLLPDIAAALTAKYVRLKGCPETRKILPDIDEATEEDWSTEYLDYILSIRVVADIDEAIEHINRYGSHHTDAIVTSNRERGDAFQRRVDSASVMWNASTRFADGFRYGLGAEVGISTSKIHARGPVGLEGLVTYQWRLSGSGHIVSDYSGERPRAYTHRDLPTE